MDNMSDFATPVHRSLFQRVLLFGLPVQGLIIVFVITVLMVVQFHQYWFLIVAAGLIVGLRMLTRKDPYYVEILLCLLREPDYLEAE